MAAKQRFIQGLVVDDVVEGEVGQSAGFGVSDDVLGTSPLSLPEFEGGDIGAGLVGDERGVPESFDGAERGVSFPRWPVTLVTRPGWPRLMILLLPCGGCDVAEGGVPAA